MDPNTVLDHALFQLTPTRTRCDLVVFSRGHNEKLASGLVEPFISHLKYAQDQIPKGGYSITLRPPSSHASWFTKATFQRFVRFVNSPEVLERFVRLEREIQQIESSIVSNGSSSTHVSSQGADGSSPTSDGIIKKSTDSSKSKGESERSDEVSQEENSKDRLQRLLGTRKVLLRKEQAMAYARALAAGFDVDNLDDLISFASAFGASRLREACIDFKDLWKQKNTDSLWMDELAAVRVCSPAELPYLGTSGIILAGENDGLSTIKLMSNGLVETASDSTASQANSETNKDNNLPASDQISSTPVKPPMQMPWPNQMPQFMYNNQSPIQQMPPYQGFPFPGMAPLPPYYQGGMLWPPNMDESSHGRRRESDYRHSKKQSSRRKERSSSVKGTDTSEEEEQTESSDPISGSESDVSNGNGTSRKQSRKKKNRKSSKTVVIRNINYITPKRRNGERDEVSDDPSSAEDEVLNERFLKQEVDEVVASLERSKHKKRSASNGLDGSSGQDIESNLLANISVEGKRNEHWGAFQDLLMRDELTNGATVEKQRQMDVGDELFLMKSSKDNAAVASHVVDLEVQKVRVQRTAAADSFVVTERDGGYESRVGVEDIGTGENFRASLKTRDSADEQFLFAGRTEESGRFQEKSQSYCPTDSTIIRSGNADDWFIVQNSGKSEKMGDDYSLSLDHERSQTEKSKMIVPIDDSFMVTNSAVNDHYDSQWRTDISMAADLSAASEPNKGTTDPSQDKVTLYGSHEPDDLCMVLARDAGMNSLAASWTPEMDYGTEIAFKEADKKISDVEATDQLEEKLPVKSKATDGKNGVGPRKDARSKPLRGSLSKSASDILSRSKKTPFVSRPIVQKSKSEKEEEMRKKMEELAIERQKRIAERSATKGSSPAALKKGPLGSKTAVLKNDKLRTQSMSKTDQLRNQAQR